MAITYIDDYKTPISQGVTAPVVVVAATASTTSAPVGGTDGINTGRYSDVRLLVAITGTITTLKLRLWVKVGGAWYRAMSTDDATPLVGTVNEARDIRVGRNVELFIQVEAISGGGTVAVSLQGVR